MLGMHVSLLHVHMSGMLVSLAAVGEATVPSKMQQSAGLQLQAQNILLACSLSPMCSPWRAVIRTVQQGVNRHTTVVCIMLAQLW